MTTSSSKNCSPLIEQLGERALLEALSKMLSIRNIEIRAEAAYLQGKIGGFFHSYIGQEAIQTAAVDALGKDNWWITTYRCHALALLLGATSEEVVAELLGRSTGNAKGRGGSMHLYTDRMLGGFGIVGGHIPIATGAAFALKYQGRKEKIAICFLGDGACAQGVFHESLNIASLWNLPCLYVIENNHWAMGTPVEKEMAIKKLAEESAPSYGIKGYTIDGMDYLGCYQTFKTLFQEVVEERRPVLLEAVTDRFRGHSISDPGAYRTKEELKKVMERDPILLLKERLIEKGWLKEDAFKAMNKRARDAAAFAIQTAEAAPWPDPATLGEDVFAP